MLRWLLALLMILVAGSFAGVYAVSPAAKVFSIAGSPPMEAIAVDALTPSNSKHTKFRGGAQLQLADSRPLALVTKLVIKKQKGLYAFKSTGAGFPKFKGKITTIGAPESVQSVAIALTRGKRNKVKDNTPTSVTVTAPSTTTTTTTSTPTTSTTLACVTTSGCFCDTGDGTIHDTCTGLQWEKKTTTGDVHDVDNDYSWAGCCNSDCSKPANYCQPNPAAAATCAAHAEGGTLGCSVCSSGTCDVDPNGLGASTTVWDWLNQLNGENFAGHSDWRMPSEGGRNSPPTGAEELETILRRPCGVEGCIDPIFVFDLAQGRSYWSSSGYPRYRQFAWYVDFDDGHVRTGTLDGLYPARAVRGRAKSCTGGQTSCGGTCVDVSSDPNNCGTCGNTCSKGEVCAVGACIGSGHCTPATPCVSGCFTDTGDGSIHDTCTGLQWEKKKDDGGANAADPHEVDNNYVWAGCCNSDCSTPANYCQPNAAAAATCAAQADGGTLGCGTCATGTCDVGPASGFGPPPFTTVWDWLNQVNAANFAGHSDWRLPSEAGCNSCVSDRACSCSPGELNTILLVPRGCYATPCIDPLFGPTNSFIYWSATAAATAPTNAWNIYFDYGGPTEYTDKVDFAGHLRAVRGSRSVSSSTTTSTSTTTTTLVSCLGDPGDGTIVDACTGFQWEKKDGLDDVVNADDPHDADNHYGWAGCCNSDCSTPANYCQPTPGAAATCAAQADDGTLGCDLCMNGTCDVDPLGLGVVTTVWDWLDQLNGAKFAGHGDWRLPSEAGCNSCWSYPDSCSSCSPHVLETILLAPYVCSASPCIDPIFGATQELSYWSSSTYPGYPHLAWIVDFHDGLLRAEDKREPNFARAVRGLP